MSNNQSLIKLVVALGNPGQEYESTRHNIGQMVFDHLSYTVDLAWQKKFRGLYSCKSINQEMVHFLKPLTYMNLSGESVLPASQFFKILPAEILVIHDELDLPFGQVAFKKGGGLAGHNGLKSIAKCLNNQEFLRMRLGISRPEREPVHSWVLSNFSAQEKITLGNFLKSVATALEVSLSDNFEKAAALYSKKNLAVL